MEYVANLLNGDVDPAAWARQREDEGWDVLGCADHLFSPRRAYPHLWVTLATFAAATSRPRLTSSFANNLLRTPVEFAQAALQMQAVSGGRFEAGLGAGWDEVEIAGAGLEYPSAGARAGRYAEAIQIVRQLLDKGACQFHGDFYDIDIPMLGPRVEPPPPLVASLGGPRTIREIAPLVDRVELKLVSRGHQGRRARRGGPRLDPAKARRRTRGPGCGRSIRRCRSACSCSAASASTSARRAIEDAARRLVHGRLLRATGEGGRGARRPR